MSVRRLIYILIAIAMAQPSVNGRRCFICGDISNEMFLRALNVTEAVPGGGKLAAVHNLRSLSCLELERHLLHHGDDAPQLRKFIAECPDTLAGCLTQIEGADVTRTCDIALDDCKTANGITYCYCQTDLCNGNDRKEALRQDDDAETDDEDLIDGSGVEDVTIDVVNDEDEDDGVMLETTTPPDKYFDEDTVTVADNHGDTRLQPSSRSSLQTFSNLFLIIMVQAVLAFSAHDDRRN